MMKKSELTEIRKEVEKAEEILKRVQEKLTPKRDKYLICVTIVLLGESIKICEKNASDTLVKVIEKIGVQRVFRLRLGTPKRPLVTKSPPAPSAYRQSSDGFHILTNSNADDKLKQLKQIRDQLDLGSDVQIKDLRSSPPEE